MWARHVHMTLQAAHDQVPTCSNPAHDGVCIHRFFNIFNTHDSAELLKIQRLKRLNTRDSTERNGQRRLHVAFTAPRRRRRVDGLPRTARCGTIRCRRPERLPCRHRSSNLVRLNEFFGRAGQVTGAVVGGEKTGHVGGDGFGGDFLPNLLRTSPPTRVLRPDGLTKPVTQAERVLKKHVRNYCSIRMSVISGSMLNPP